jgi:Ca2+-binding EF-hand superfamily protein
VTGPELLELFLLRFVGHWRCINVGPNLTMDSFIALYLPLIVCGSLLLLHASYGICLLACLRQREMTFQNKYGFHQNDFFLTTLCMALAVGAWFALMMFDSYASTIEFVAQAGAVAGSAYVTLGGMGAWVVTVTKILLWALFISTSLHALLMNAVLIQLGRKRKTRRELRPREVSRVAPNGQTVLFGTRRTCTQKVVYWTTGFLVQCISVPIQIIHRIVFLDFALFWFPMPFYEFMEYEQQVKSLMPLQVQGELTKLEAHFGDFYFFWLRTKLMNIMTLGIFERCCARHTFEEWLDKHLVWRRTPPDGFNDDFKYFSAKLTYAEVLAAFLMVLLSPVTLFLGLPFVYLYVQKKWLQKVRFGGRTPVFKNSVWKNVLKNVCRGKLFQTMDENITFNMEGKLWYWDQGVHSLTEENRALRMLLENNHIEIVIPSSVHINPRRYSSQPKISRADFWNAIGNLEEVESEDISPSEVLLDTVENEASKAADEEPKVQKAEKKKQSIWEGNAIIDITDFVGYIWPKYDIDKDGMLNAQEMRKLVREFTGQPVSLDRVDKFLKSIDKGGDGMVDEEELVKFIKSGVKLPEKERSLYRKRGSFHETVIHFFDGVERQRRSLNELKSGGIPSVTELLDRIWIVYDTDGGGSLDAEETKRLIEDFTGNRVSRKMVIDFLKSIDTDGDSTIQKDELDDFIRNGIELDDQECADYAKRGKLHKIIVKFFYGVKKKMKKAGSPTAPTTKMPDFSEIERFLKTNPTEGQTTEL